MTPLLHSLNEADARRHLKCMPGHQAFGMVGIGRANVSNIERSVGLGFVGYKKHASLIAGYDGTIRTCVCTNSQGMVTCTPRAGRTVNAGSGSASSRYKSSTRSSPAGCIYNASSL